MAISSAEHRKASDYEILVEKTVNDWEKATQGTDRHAACMLNVKGKASLILGALRDLKAEGHSQEILRSLAQRTVADLNHSAVKICMGTNVKEMALLKGQISEIGAPIFSFPEEEVVSKCIEKISLIKDNFLPIGPQLSKEFADQKVSKKQVDWLTLGVMEETRSPFHPAIFGILSDELLKCAKPTEEQHSHHKTVSKI